jgi:hypothetical protein
MNIMRRLQVVITLAVLSLSLFIATNPVLAAAGGNGEGNNGNGKGNGGPGEGALPEAPIAVLLPIVGLVIVGVVLATIFMRRRNMQTVTE